MFIFPSLHQWKMKPRVPDAPNIVLRSRDLMKQYGVLESVKNCFSIMLNGWMSPVNVAVYVHQEAPTILPEVKMIRVLSVDTRKLCWSNKLLSYSGKWQCTMHISWDQSIPEKHRQPQQNLGTLPRQSGTGDQKWMDYEGLSQQ